MCAPTPPSPQNTIQQQTSANRETAITQANLNMVDQTDAAGNKLSYAQNGTWADGTPRYTATQSLSDAGKSLLASSQATQQNLGNLAQQQSARLGTILNETIDFGDQKNYLEGLTSGALDKTWDRDAQRFETDLVNRGFRPGTSAYNDQIDQFRTSKSNAYNAANVGNYNTALQSQLALRNQGINEISALAGGAQVQSPAFASTPQTSVGGTDVAGIMNANYGQQNQQYNNQQSMLGGLFSAGANLLPLAFSDSRLKTNIEDTGERIAGVPVKTWDWKGGGSGVGVIAQELERKHPALVDNTHPSGFKRVNYMGLLDKAGAA
jgi:hypothetical protein